MNSSSASLFSTPSSQASALQIETFVSGPLQTNTFLLIDTQLQQFVVIDPSIQSDAALARAQELQKSGNTLQAIWNTHGHFDHIYDNARWKKVFGAPVWAHAGDEFFLENLGEQSIWFGLPAPETTAIDHFLNDGDTLKVGDFACRVLFLPGHSPGSVGFYFEAQNLCIQGDVLFEGSVGRTDLPASNERDLAVSVRRLFELPPQTQILTGHGAATTIAAEKRDNTIARALLARF